MADEGDAIWLRTSTQTGNTVHLDRIGMSPDFARALSLEYIALTNGLVDEPRFYRTVLADCTTIVCSLMRRIDPGLPIDQRVLFSGCLPDYLDDVGALDGRFALAETKAMSVLPGDVPRDLDSRDYSAALRVGVRSL